MCEDDACGDRPIAAGKMKIPELRGTDRLERTIEY